MERRRYADKQADSYTERDGRTFKGNRICLIVMKVLVY